MRSKLSSSRVKVKVDITLCLSIWLTLRCCDVSHEFYSRSRLTMSKCDKFIRDRISKIVATTEVIIKEDIRQLKSNVWNCIYSSRPHTWVKEAKVFDEILTSWASTSHRRSSFSFCLLLTEEPMRTLLGPDHSISPHPKAPGSSSLTVQIRRIVSFYKQDTPSHFVIERIK